MARRGDGPIRRSGAGRLRRRARSADEGFHLTQEQQQSSLAGLPIHSISRRTVIRSRIGSLLLLLAWASLAPGAAEGQHVQSEVAAPASAGADTGEIGVPAGFTAVSALLPTGNVSVDRPPPAAPQPRGAASPADRYALLLRAPVGSVEPTAPLCEWLPYHATAPPPVR